MGDAHDAADVMGVLDHLVEAEKKEGSQLPAFVSDTFCTFGGENI